MRMTGIKTGVGLPHNIGHSNTWKNYSVSEVKEYKSRQYSSEGNKYRFTLGDNLVCFQPDKGKLIVIAKIKIDFGEINRYYLEWLPGSRQLTPEQRGNAESALGMEAGKRYILPNKGLSPLLRGVEQAIMWERSKDLFIPPPKKEEKPEYYSGKRLVFSSRNKLDREYKKLKQLNIPFTKVDRYTLVID